MRPTLVFFAISFGLPWLGWTALALSGLDRGTTAARLLFYTGDFMTVGGLVATYVAAGGEGLRHLLRRAVRIRVPVLWALFAIAVPLVVSLVTMLIYGSTHDGIGRFEIAGLGTYVAGGTLLALTTGPLGEEAGWRGFYLPRLLSKYGPLPASLILGLVWSLWHYPLYYGSVMGSAGGIARFTASVLCFSLLLTILWAHTGGSVFWAVVLHWTINISPGVARALLPDVRPAEGATDALQLVVLVVVTVLALALVGGTRLRQRLDAVRDGLGPERVAY